MLILLNTAVFADDNADTGSGETEDALKDKGFYRTSEYMYKVSLYVGTSDDSDEFSSLSGNWQQIGTNEVYIKPSSFSIPSGTVGGNGSKIDYQNGQSLSAISINRVINDNPPPIPITHGGSIEAVKSYFGDTGTLNMLINEYALQQGVTREALVSMYSFNIDGELVTGEPDRILPNKIDGEYQNE